MKGRESEGTSNSALSAETDLLQRHGKGYISPSLADCSQATNFEGLGSLKTREKLPLDSFARGNMLSGSLGGDMSTLAPIPSVGSDDFETTDSPLTGAKAPFNAVKDAGEWMSKMWMGTLDMTRKMCETTVPVPCLMQSPNSKTNLKGGKPPAPCLERRQSCTPTIRLFARCDQGGCCSSTRC